MRASSRPRLLGGIAAGAAATAVTTGSLAPATAEPSRDSCLLLLAPKLMQAWAAENEAWAASEGERTDDGPLTLRAMELTQATGAIVDQIETFSALTLPGLLVKMEAFQWCREGQPITADDVLPCYSVDHPATNERLMVSMLIDLNAMGRVWA